MHPLFSPTLSFSSINDTWWTSLVALLCICYAGWLNIAFWSGSTSTAISILKNNKNQKFVQYDAAECAPASTLLLTTIMAAVPTMASAEEIRQARQPPLPLSRHKYRKASETLTHPAPLLRKFPQTLFFFPRNPYIVVDQIIPFALDQVL